jgi:hypothetical protein
MGLVILLFRLFTSETCYPGKRSSLFSDILYELLPDLAMVVKKREAGIVNLFISGLQFPCGLLIYSVFRTILIYV